MPMPIGPVKFACTRCQWHRSLMLQSDTLILPSWTRCCPRCGCDKMQQTKGNHFDNLLGTIAKRLARTLDR